MKYGSPKVIHYTSVKAEDVANARGTRIRVLISKDDGAPTYAMRFFEMDPQGHIPEHKHPWEHEILFLEGGGIVGAGEDEKKVTAGYPHIIRHFIAEALQDVHGGPHREHDVFDVFEHSGLFGLLESGNEGLVEEVGGVFHRCRADEGDLVTGQEIHKGLRLGAGGQGGKRLKFIGGNRLVLDRHLFDEDLAALFAGDFPVGGPVDHALVVGPQLGLCLHRGQGGVDIA